MIPVYNSERSLGTLIERLEPVLIANFEEFEVILVDDGSRDKSGRKINELAVDFPFIEPINLMRNFGQHNALLCGIRYAKNGVIITMDDDLQNPPEEIPVLMDKLFKGFDVVYGKPKNEQHSIFRNFASQLTKIALQKGMGAETARNVSAFRVFRADVRDAFKNYNAPYVSVDVLLTWGTSRFAAVPVKHDKREMGESNYTFGKLASHALNMVTGFTILPLQIASFIGFFFTLFGIGVLGYVLTRYLFGSGNFTGFTFLASIIAIFAGAQLFAIGIIGEYLARIHFQTMERPSYSIRKRRLNERVAGRGAEESDRVIEES